MCGELCRDLREAWCQVEPATGLQPHAAAVDEGDDPVSIELRLVAPLPVRARGITALCQHRSEMRGELFLRTTGCETRRLEARRQVRRRELIEAHARE